MNAWPNARSASSPSIRATVEMMAQGWVDAHCAPIDPTFKIPAQGAATQVWTATSPRLADIGGVYWEDGDVAVVTRGDEAAGARPHAIDPEAVERRWARSAALTGVDAFAARR
ncbi:hypothetical protein [Burkholderia sp. BCC1977]|uniref:hypothetical protein n=1 Tax=Burkholderia sp. BCC1977 TaxID=2817440 RepID=UPI002ABD9DDD|nr:hypothetical protein [Burkholderia sp. BCC1977]